ncbi:MAG: hypothetical protein FJ403_11575 [Verrucomicrobia bacterium]|nr:hypothetical protein [Verrucomicrobiota bacterium]
MGFFKKKRDPISDRSRLLNAEIARLEAQIKNLNAKVEQSKSQPRLRSTALPHHQPSSDSAETHSGSGEPIFEAVDRRKMNVAPEAETPAHYNDLGVRKCDLAAAWRRLQNHFRGPPANNPKLVSYLAAGSIKGLRPLRYEKRVARNRFIALLVLLLLLLWGIFAVFVKTN